MDKEERDELIEDYIPLAKSICKKYYNLPYEERYSEALYGLVKAARNFDPEKGNFAPYARKVINNQLKTYSNSRNSREEFCLDFNSLEAMSDDYDAANKKNIKAIYDKEDNYKRIDFMSVLSVLTKKEKLLVIYIAKGYSQSECAEQLDISQPTVSRMLDRLKEKECIKNANKK